jgi:hypothetical protein
VYNASGEELEDLGCPSFPSTFVIPCSTFEILRSTNEYPLVRRPLSGAFLNDAAAARVVLAISQPLGLARAAFRGPGTAVLLPFRPNTRHGR